MADSTVIIPEDVRSEIKSFKEYEKRRIGLLDYIDKVGAIDLPELMSRESMTALGYKSGKELAEDLTYFATSYLIKIGIKLTANRDGESSVRFTRRVRSLFRPPYL